MRIRASGSRGLEGKLGREGKSAARSKPGGAKVSWEMLPHVLALLKPRRGILAVGFVLMVVNRLAGLVLPASPKYLVDDIIGNHQVNLLWPLVLAVMGATLVQGLTSFSLTQLLSK